MLYSWVRLCLIRKTPYSSTVYLVKVIACALRASGILSSKIPVRLFGARLRCRRRRCRFTSNWKLQFPAGVQNSTRNSKSFKKFTHKLRKQSLLGAGIALMVRRFGPHSLTCGKRCRISCQQLKRVMNLKALIGLPNRVHVCHCLDRHSNRGRTWRIPLVEVMSQH